MKSLNAINLDRKFGIRGPKTIFFERFRQPTSMSARKETAGPSTALRSGRDDSSVVAQQLLPGKLDPCNRIVIPTGAYPDFLPRAASNDHVCGSR
jgi:hypothetical protein